MIDAPGGPFWWPEANEAFRDDQTTLAQDIPVLELDVNVNDPLFAPARAAENLLELISARKLG